MLKNDRLKLLSNSFENMVKQGKEGSFLVFSTTEKFVQFAYDPDEDWLICDIPMASLTPEERKRLETLEEFEKNSGATEVETNEFVAYQHGLNGNEIDKAIELVERIFSKVFLLPDTYDVDVEITLGF
jgi:hypothetical protein